MTAIVSTTRLNLRQLLASDEKILAAELNTPDVTKHLGKVLSAEEQRELFRWLLRDQQQEYNHTFWPVEVKETGEFVGICGLVTVDEEDSTVLGATELGYRLKASAQGNRYAVEASAACLQYAFEQEECWWVVSRTTLENIGSWSVMQKVGMRHDPRLDYTSKDGTPFIVHVMTRREWRASGRKLIREVLANPAARHG